MKVMGGGTPSPGVGAWRRRVARGGITWSPHALPTRLAVAGRRAFCLSTLIAATGLSSLSGQEDPLARAMEEVAREIEQGDSLGWSTTVPSPAVLLEADSALRARYLEALHDYHRWGLTHRQAVFRWQFLSSKITFATVLLLVLSGITFAGIQFYKALKVATSGQAGDGDGRPSRPACAGRDRVDALAGRVGRRPPRALGRTSGPTDLTVAT